MKKIFNIVVVLFLIGSLSSCGTIFKHKQIGKSHYKKLDPNIVTLDSAAFALFVIPGFAAITLDYFTGTLYIPYEGPEIHHTPIAKPIKAETKSTKKEPINKTKDSNSVTVDVEASRAEDEKAKDKEIKEEKVEEPAEEAPAVETKEETKKSGNLDDIFADE